MTKDSKQPRRQAIRVKEGQTWILSDPSSGNDIGGVTFEHDSQDDHYQPWLLVDGNRIAVGLPLSQLRQAAPAIGGEVQNLTRPRNG